MAKLYLSLGSNQGDRLNSLVEATKLINIHVGEVILNSPVFESEPWGFIAKTTFYNLVLLVETVLKPQHVLTEILKIEKELGRIRSGKVYISRIIDIDILFYDDAQIDEGSLAIPHPRLQLRRFVLEPLAAIAPGLDHPVFHITILQMLHQLEDKGSISVTLGKQEFTDLWNASHLS